MNIYFKGNPTVIMGCTRLSTQGSKKISCNNHPFFSKNMDFTLTHNGVLYNDTTLRRTEKLPPTKIQTDSYVAVQLIDKKNTLSFNSLRFMAESLIHKGIPEPKNSDKAVLYILSNNIYLYNGNLNIV